MQQTPDPSGASGIPAGYTVVGPMSDWEEHRRLIMYQLTQQSDHISRLRQDVSSLSTQMTELRVETGKSHVWGMVWGAVAGVVAVAGSLIARLVDVGAAP